MGVCLTHPAIADTLPFLPDDPYFFTNNPPGFPGQWHLDRQSSSAVVDVNVRGAWERGLTGQGVTIGIVEEAFHYTHPDLAPNYSAEHSWDFVENDPDPYPTVLGSHAHATSVAGVAAARGGNGIGVTGAAPHASIASLAVNNLPHFVAALYSHEEDMYLAAASQYHASGTSSGIQIYSHSHHPTHPFGYVAWPQLEASVIASTHAGAIHVWLGGNYRQYHRANNYNTHLDSMYVDLDLDGQPDPQEPAFSGDANTHTVLNLPESIVVAALGSDGRFADYASFGANIFVTAPSLSENLLGITTTDNMGEGGYNNSTGDAIYHPSAGEDLLPDLDYTTTFSGTSSATPLVAGILALAKEAQPRLDTRFAKHLLARTSRVVDPDDSTPMGGWTTNSAGFSFNNNYGFGLIDADALTTAATQFSGVTPLVTSTIDSVTIAESIPMNSDEGMSRTFSLPDLGELEEMQVYLNLDTGGLGAGYSSRGDIEAILRSPSGTESLLMFRNESDQHKFSALQEPTKRYLDWTFTTNAFWGETAAGDWTLTVRDVAMSGFTAEDWFPAVWNSFAVTARHGSLISVPEPPSLVIALLGLTPLVHRFHRRDASTRNQVVGGLSTISHA